MANAQEGGGNTKFIIAGILLLAGAGGLWAMLQPSAPPPPPPEPPKTAEVERVNPMAQELILDEEPVPDAAVAEVAPEPEPVKKPRGTGVKRPKPTKWDCSGDMERGKLQEVIRNNRGQVRTCYERRLKRNNMLQGALNLKVRVGNGGRVDDTQVTGSLGDKEVFQCVSTIAKSWTFPVPDGGTCAVISIPFQFSPKN